MSLTFKMFLPVIIISVITIISMIIAKIVTDEDGWVLGIFFVGALLFATVFSITLSKNKDALSRVTNGLEEVQPFVKYDSRYIRQHISDWFIDEYFSKDINSPLANYKGRIDVYNAIFIEKLLQEMYEKDTTVNFELFCEKHIDLFFTLPTGCIKQLLKAYDFSKAFILGHMESFKSKKCGKAAKESLNIK